MVRLRQFYRSLFPQCFCQDCGACQYLASFRFPTLHLNSCRCCRFCNNSHALRHGPQIYRNTVGWRGLAFDEFFEMSWSYRHRVVLGNFLCWLHGRVIPNDIDYTKEN
jgi:hypothetical protein